MSQSWEPEPDPGPSAAELERQDPTAGWAGAEMLLDSGWRAIGQPVEFDLQIMLMSDGPPRHDARRVARQLAEAISGAVVCYPSDYERSEAPSAEGWAEQGFWVHERLLEANREAGWGISEEFVNWLPYAPRVMLNIGHHGIGAKRFMEKVLPKLSLSAVGVVGDETLAPGQIDLFLPDRPMWKTAVVQRPIDPASPADCTALAETARVTYSYSGDVMREAGSLYTRGVAVMAERHDGGDSATLRAREAFLNAVTSQSELLGYAPCFYGDAMLGVRDGVIPLSDQIIVEIPDLDPADSRTAWPDEGPLWLRPPVMASVDPLAKLEGEDYKAVRLAAELQVAGFHRALRVGGATRSCVAGVGATTPETAHYLGALVAHYVREHRPATMADPRFTVVAPGIFGGDAGAAAAVHLSREFPDARVDLMVSPERSPSLTAGLDREGVGRGFRVVPAKPIRELPDYGRLDAVADGSEPLWVPPRLRRTVRNIATATTRKVSRHVRS